MKFLTFDNQHVKLSMVSSPLLLLLFFNSFLISILSQTTDTITATQPLSDRGTIVSAQGSFELAFFSPGSSTNRYVGIRYGNIGEDTFVWVANRDAPLNDTSGVLTLTSEGTLTIASGNGTVVWGSNRTRSLRNPVAQLLDSGNLVIRERDDENSENYAWQSFDYIGDTILPGMKSGINLVTGHENYLTSWRSENDPSIGEYSNRLDPNGVPQFFLKRGSVDRFRAGPWNGLQFSGMPNLVKNLIYEFEFVSNKREMFYRYNLLKNSVVTRFQLVPDGTMRRFIWVERTREWQLYLSASMDNCDRYDLCGPHGTCNINNNPPCGCLTGFEPRRLGAWVRADWSDGCVRRVPLECGRGEGFLRIPSVKVPDTRQSWANGAMNLEECEAACRRNCNCTAYANSDIRNGGSGCINWFGDLIDIREYTGNGQDIYIRLDSSEIARNSSSTGLSLALKIIIPFCIGIVILIIILIVLIIRKRRQKLRLKEIREEEAEEEYHTNEGEAADLELPLFNFITLIEATNKFSAKKKLGQGGFGPVYKGVLKDGQEIAVKRLSKQSRQGLHEFKNEVKCIAKLQHRNLVKLLGCCIQAEERMLVYEYMPNRSLDSFIFHRKQDLLLDWPKRHHIINGIARGLLYLHQDSRLRIIHRDLKASNVLLDYNMNPKISDFGMARSFRGDETEANTNRVVGTYGYMSPEYAIDGLFSVKSDVFSFGVLVLEIVSGKRNRGFTHANHKLNLLGHAWKLFNEQRSIELIDETFKDTCNVPEVLRSVHVGLLCVQQDPEDRPNMSTVVLMLSSEIALPQPKKPGFYAERNLVEAETSSSNQDKSTTNEVTITLLHPR